LNKHSGQKNNIYFFILILLLIAGCSRTEKKTEYLAKVNDSYLTEEDLTAISGGYGGQKFFKEELIRNWVNRELLYQEAKREGITESEEYLRITGTSAKELAAAMMLEKMFRENMPVYKAEDIKKFFEENPDIFSLSEIAYLVNSVEFTDENRAVMFRSAAVETDWNKALNVMVNDQSLSKLENNRLLHQYDIQPLKLNRVINELYPGEVSLVMPDEMGNYLVIKLISKLDTGTIPPFDVIKDDVEKRFISVKRSQILKEYYEELYTASDIDVKQQEL
jgi:peptidyl-prolyl cis-trans isomerase C